MNLLLPFFAMAAVLGWALIHFLRTKDGPAIRHTAEIVEYGGQRRSSEDKEFRFLGDTIFSEEDWDFIRREEAPFLTRLFIEERRSLAAEWLKDSAARIRAVRANHLRNSRHSENLDVVAELKLLLLFLYLISLCRSMLVVVRVAQPTTPRRLALHFEKMAGRLEPARGEASLPVPAEELPRSRR